MMKGNYTNRTGWERYGSCMLYCRKGVVVWGLYLSPQGLYKHLTPIRVKGSSACRRCLLRDGYFVLASLGTDEYYEYPSDSMRPLKEIETEESTSD